jgi:polyphosphate kinase 2 (PPK2 family)
MKRKEYEKHLEKLQVELCHLQEWIKAKQLRIVIVFEGRDGAGKGGTIRALTERVSPRVFRVVALPAPTDREKSRDVNAAVLRHFPAKGEVVIFDRSWYARAGVSTVMGFCTPEQHDRFLELCPRVEKFMVEGGTV